MNCFVKKRLEILMFVNAMCQLKQKITDERSNSANGNLDKGDEIRVI